MVDAHSGNMRELILRIANKYDTHTELATLLRQLDTSHKLSQ